MNYQLPSFLSIQTYSETATLLEKTHLPFYVKQINHEKRKRNQAYVALDYFLSLSTISNYFSEELINLILETEAIAKIGNQEIITSDCFLISLLTKNQVFRILFQQCGIDLKNFIFLENISDKQSRSLKIFQDSFKNDKKNSLFKNYSYEFLTLIEQASKNALIKYKSPVLTPEILLITCLEEKKSKIRSHLEKAIQTELQLSLLKFKLLKKLYLQENAIKHHIPLNYLSFAYLLKSHISYEEFEHLRGSQVQASATLFFRNNIIAQILKFNIFKYLKKDIYMSRISSRRFYN